MASEQTINEIKSALNEFFAMPLNVEKKILYKCTLFFDL
jgi:hypothetical protein